jgi:hypothetical protein
MNSSVLVVRSSWGGNRISVHMKVAVRTKVADYSVVAVRSCLVALPVPRCMAFAPLHFVVHRASVVQEAVDGMELGSLMSCMGLGPLVAGHMVLAVLPAAVGMTLGFSTSYMGLAAGLAVHMASDCLLAAADMRVAAS